MSDPTPEDAEATGVAATSGDESSRTVVVRSPQLCTLFQQFCAGLAQDAASGEDADFDQGEVDGDDLIEAESVWFEVVPSAPPNER